MHLRRREMKKKRDKRIPMTNFDRVQALLRIPKYLKAIKTMKGRFIFDERKSFFKKYHLNDIIMDHEFLEKYSMKDKSHPSKFPKHVEQSAIFTDDWVTRVIPYERAKMIKEKIEMRSEDGKPVKRKIFRHDPSPWLRERRYLTIEIDLMKNKDEILTRVGKEIDFFIRYVEKVKTRKKETIYSPWGVHDLHHKERLNFSQIARKLSGSEGHPSYGPALMAVYKDVRRAYEKALMMINQVKKDIKTSK
jgi:hypothetical protein